MTSTEQCIGSREEAEGFVALVCFKHGPPTRTGVELEWTVHHRDDPSRPLDADALRAALGAHAPGTLVPGSVHLPLARGADVTVEPGGQVEISSLPFESVPQLLAAAASDARQLAGLLGAHDLVLGDSGLDAHRTPRRILRTPRYDAMEGFFDRVGPEGRRMMCSTASLQVCVDAGEERDTPARWNLLHTAGPALVALFANSPRLAGRSTGWVSARLRATLGTCPPYTGAPSLDDDPAQGWARLAMEAPVICLRGGPGERWDAPAGLTFGAWADGALGTRPSYADLEYHLSTLFPPVRPRGHLEVRYLDAQPGDGWTVPLTLISALLADRMVVDKAMEVAEPAAGRWLEAARHGLDDRLVRRAARELAEIGCRSLDLIGLDAQTESRIADRLDRTLSGHARRNSA
jgi:glutamate--cysteine ligase